MVEREGKATAEWAPVDLVALARALYSEEREVLGEVAMERGVENPCPPWEALSGETRGSIVAWVYVKADKMREAFEAKRSGHE